MQQARVIAVPYVLCVELPVVRQYLAGVTEDLDRAVHHAPDARRDLRAEIFLDRRCVRGVTAEHEPAKRRDLEFARPVIPELEVCRHTALAVNAVAKGDTRQVALQVVAPRMIDAGETPRVAAGVEA